MTGARLDQSSRDLAAWLHTVVDPRHQPLVDAILGLRRSTFQRGPGTSGTYRPARPVGPDPRPELLRLLAAPYTSHDGYREEWT
ncbi:DUF6221 family protein [Micromonospora carbonacea]|uniref:Uncharacterized protein n=1 Tax=Micromonospora carbonacea TaxID=47853 RepID=A0A1C4WYB6_9ACTN|nr:DUF6221 family protein [Micromonospora carbonacea]SCF01216.1 hypothetical protein GA0070563_104111 [Micromonospora carbonacea]